MPTANSEKENKIAIDFIDPLFAVVLSISFSQIIAEPWFCNWHLILVEANRFHLASLFLAYLFVVQSWIGYHRSVKKSQIIVEKRWGRLRFYLDILLLIAYLVLLVSYENFRRELNVLAAIFLVYVAWDQCKRKEYQETYESADSTARRGVTVFWFLVFSLLAAFYEGYPQSASHVCEDWTLLLAAIAGSLAYRWHKDRLWWKALLLRLGFPRNNA